MRRKNVESLSDILAKIIKEPQLEKHLLERKIIEAWSDILGNNVMSYTQEIKYQNKVLFVCLTSSVLRHELFISKSDILASINNHIGSIAIKDIVFR